MNIFKGETSMKEKVVLKKKLFIFEYRRDRNISIYIWPTFSHVANTYQIAQESNSTMGKCSNKKLRTWNLINDGTLRNTADFASAIGHVNYVKISDFLAFVVMLLFSSICSHLKIAFGGGPHFYKVARLWKHPWGSFFYNSFKKSLAVVSFYFHLQFRKTILKRLLCYEVNLVRKCRKQCQNQWNKDF